MDDSSVERMRILAPHLRRAIMIGKLVDLRKVEASNFESVVNGLLDAVVLVDARLRIVYANESATRMISEAKIIKRGTREVLRSMTPMPMPNCEMRLPAASGPNPRSKSGAPPYSLGQRMESAISPMFCR
jgi:hypothetical protein